jgi:hypothetical protein
MRRHVISKTEVIRHRVDCEGYQHLKQTAASGFRVQISYIANSKHEHTAIMKHNNLNCKCSQYRHPKKQNLSLTTSNQEPSNVKKVRVN